MNLINALYMVNSVLSFMRACLRRGLMLVSARSVLGVIVYIHIKSHCLQREWVRLSM
jgi:hypothetical protein